ncbi:MAG: hypothetical protein QXU98_11655 [Candidatus Parvarchaeota archaeon]
MSQPIANVGLSFYDYPCGKNKQYLCLQAIGGSSTSNVTLNPNQTVTLPVPPTPVLPVPTKIYLSGSISLNQGVGVNAYFSAFNIYGNSFSVPLIYQEPANTAQAVNILDQDIILEPYAFTGATSNSGLVIQALATVTITQAYLYEYIQVPLEE